MKRIISTQYIYVNFNFRGEIAKNLTQDINLYFLGDIHCNTPEGKPKYPEKETPLFLEVNGLVSKTHQSRMRFDLYSDGSYKLTQE